MAEIVSGSRLPLTVFIASPSDVAPERQKLREIIADLNQTVARHLGFVLDATGWEDLPPSVHEERTQELINPSVDKADIFILILWKRLGTRDKRGFPTKEEFDRAYDLYQRTQRPRIVLYLKSTPASLNDIEPSQLAKVQVFRKRGWQDSCSI